LTRNPYFEKYDPEKNMWEELKIRLIQGIEASICVSNAPNSITIIGGKTIQGPTNAITTYNLEERTVTRENFHLNKYRTLHKGFKTQDGSVYVMGGDEW